jgi:uncharacterized protein YecT (DUF1311 family)
MEILMNTGHRCLLAITLCGGFVLLPHGFGQQGSDQQTPARPKKVLTPEQRVYQQQWKEYMAKRQSLQAQAKQVFDTEMAREKASDCPEAKTTYDFNICYGDQVATTDQNLKSYEGIIRELMASQPQMPGEPTTEMHGPGGPSLTPKQIAEEFDRVEQDWRQYREKACTAAFHQFDGGTAGPSFEMECKLKLTRGHMRELDMIYGEDLHM